MNISTPTSATMKEAKYGTPNIDEVKEESLVKNSAIVSTTADNSKKDKTHPNAKQKGQTKPPETISHRSCIEEQGTHLTVVGKSTTKHLFTC
jgi:hypothetical protein